MLHRFPGGGRIGVDVTKSQKAVSGVTNFSGDAIQSSLFSVAKLSGEELGMLSFFVDESESESKVKKYTHYMIF